MSISLTLDDLIDVCPECSGTGQKPQQESGGGGSYAPRVVAVYGDNKCNRCMGTGRWGLTEGGKALVEFTKIVEQLKNYGRLG